MGGSPGQALAYSLWIWPILCGISEELTCQSFALPRLQVRTGQGWPVAPLLGG
jgi:hypothetical protein